MKRVTEARISAVTTAAALITEQQEADIFGSYKISEADIRAMSDIGRLLDKHAIEVVRLLIKLENEET